MLNIDLTGKRALVARAGKPLVFVACLAPALRLAIDAYFGKLGANPIADVELPDPILTLVSK
jgi:hypothetical protein